MIITTIFAFGVGKAATDKPKALKCDSIYNIDLFFSRKKGFQAFIYIYYKSFDIHILF